jgi:hypothetical protein
MEELRTAVSDGDGWSRRVELDSGWRAAIADAATHLPIARRW